MANSSIYINLFCFLVSRPKTVPSPKKGHTKVVIRESTVCLSGLALSLKQGEYLYDSASPQVCYLLGHVLKINVGTSLFTFANKFFKLLL